MNTRIPAAAALAAGAAAMYLLDPDHGRRRRARLRDRAVHLAHRAGDALDATARDLRNRTQGLVAEARGVMRREEIDDAILAERVRAQIGGVVGHPGSIAVSAASGTVMLGGPVLGHEVDGLIASVRSVRGVRGVDPQLEIHDRPEDIPGLQGRPAPPRGGGRQFELFQRRWSPTARVLAGTAGVMLAAGSARRGTPFGIAAGLAGTALAARAATNMEMRRLIGVGAGRRAVMLQKTINIDAPIDQVYAFWTNYERYPQFMANVREVRISGPGVTRWTVAGPAGASVTWEAVTTQEIPERLVAWKTADGTAVGHSGVVRFQPNRDGSTKVEVRLSYNPVAGAMGHVVAKILGTDPKTHLDEDLMRMKSLIETGRVPSNAAADRRT